MGPANYAKPKFTSFNDTHLADVFERPSVEMPAPYHLTLAVGIPALFCAFIGVQFLASVTSSFRDSLPDFFKTQSARNISSGHPTEGKIYSRLLQTVHTFLVASTSALIITITCLLELSSLPDNDNSRKCLIRFSPYTCVINERSRFRLEGRRNFNWILGWAPLCVTFHTKGKRTATERSGFFLP